MQSMYMSPLGEERLLYIMQKGLVPVYPGLGFWNFKGWSFSLDSKLKVESCKVGPEALHTFRQTEESGLGTSERVHPYLTIILPIAPASCLLYRPPIPFIVTGSR